ncbi:MAG: ATP-binding protein [Gallionellaceae bacterium]
MNASHNEQMNISPQGELAGLAESFPPVGIEKKPGMLNGLSLRTKGVWVMVIFLIYTLTAGFIMSRERNALYSDLQQLESIHLDEEHQLGLNMLVTRAILIANENYYSGALDSPAGINTATRSVAVQVEAVLDSLTKMAQSYPLLIDDVVALREDLRDLTSKPPSRELITEVRNNLHKLVLGLDQVTVLMEGQKDTLIGRYHQNFDKLSIVWSVTAAIGVVFLGGLIMLFVSRLTWDIRRVQDRALAIIEGYRGKPLVVSRYDEIGSLMEAVNKMQLELRQHEMQMELIRQQRFHKEKMVAVGSLASVVAHEINNPLSAIVGAAQSMSQLGDAQLAGNHEYIEQAEVILAQAKRVMNITRQISEFSMPQSAQPELLDLNSLIRNTVKFITFDRRFSYIEIVLNLDPSLPAIYAVGDHITQVVMNLLINSADAAEGRSVPKPRITISTSSQDNGVIIRVTDNGTGMNKATLDRVFEEYFTTKPLGKGSGIGMAVSKSMIESGSGSIAIDSELGIGTTVTIWLPVNQDRPKEA